MFNVNWFRKDADDRYLWPGFGENSRVLKWIFERCEGAGAATETPIGHVPASGGLDLTGLDVAREELDELTRIDTDGWLVEANAMVDYYAQFGERTPSALAEQLGALRDRLEAAV